uniref:Secreted protein n=1 Tax=Paramoeba aestuarina TaxID=180227 RepID=A0A7S4JWH0_9EUKA|mmetsp:Transcript_13568/g.21004  ORF Transcript_13568/g.21004 Transcript_13568/m.21004 type:complete len:175 (+) Transcript_13568:47-571(+)|eukprot:CAMPEP_0201521580 /NCGR_PEP_ID=MMETSP0161_2-20130828/14943_1 /ASSEMBLY_ACC=CAM_ASM_000251 /TAXON_ID=180227 /ORGANISM="Neoparamoeba aestuarina, Strain SoJaBio B1-5/56/2" /LENGTH=174 /DNA_ID=CAMNT_0047920237 /DNA_START=66 /DNA_END=590 /DNA_ORIENTATION=+
MMMKGLIFVALVAMFSVEAKVIMNCPPSPVAQHAGCQVSVTFKNSCDSVRAEISNRVNGQFTNPQNWHDPHNNGTYNFVVDTNQTTWELKRLTGDGKYTDLMIYTFDVSDDGNGCDVGACSESQVFSISDYGTNFCNVHDLYCSDSGCHPLTILTYTESVGTCTEAEPSVCYQD